MSFGSRLRRRRNTLTVAVKLKSLSGGQHSEANVTGLEALTATRSQGSTGSQSSARETVTETGAIVIVTDIFFFEQLSTGALPAITEKHVLVDGSGVRYEVLSVSDQGGEGNRLRVMTRRLR